jgi:uncharacterized protein YndB with AHSA1/START domain
MGTVESTVTIARPPEDVFGFFLDVDKYGMKRVESVLKGPDGPTEAGTLFRFNHGTGRETTMRFTSLEANRKIEFEEKVGPLRPEGTFLIEPAEGGSKLTVRVAPNPIGPLKVASRLISVIGQRLWDKRLVRIKTAIER